VEGLRLAWSRGPGLDGQVTGAGVASRARLPHRVAIVPRIHPGQGSLRAIGGTVLVGGSKDETENGWARRQQDMNFLASPRA
jgi:hypothetical protein